MTAWASDRFQTYSAAPSFWQPIQTGSTRRSHNRRPRSPGSRQPSCFSSYWCSGARSHRNVSGYVKRLWSSSTKLGASPSNFKRSLCHSRPLQTSGGPVNALEKEPESRSLSSNFLSLNTLRLNHGGRLTLQLFLNPSPRTLERWPNRQSELTRKRCFTTSGPFATSRWASRRGPVSLQVPLQRAWSCLARKAGGLKLKIKRRLPRNDGKRSETRPLSAARISQSFNRAWRRPVSTCSLSPLSACWEPALWRRCSSSAPNQEARSAGSWGPSSSSLPASFCFMAGSSPVFEWPIGSSAAFESAARAQESERSTWWTRPALRSTSDAIRRTENPASEALRNAFARAALAALKSSRARWKRASAAFSSLICRSSFSSGACILSRHSIRSPNQTEMGAASR